MSGIVILEGDAPLVRADVTLGDIFFSDTVDFSLLQFNNFLGQVQIFFGPIRWCYFAGILYHIVLYIIHSY